MFVDADFWRAVPEFSSVVAGMNVHVHRQAQPKRSGLAQPAREDGREATILLVDKINRLPWEKKGTAATKATAKSEPKEEAAATPAAATAS